MKARNRLIAIFLVLLAGGTLQLSAGLPEPGTTLYGKVIHRAYGHEHLLTEGSLTWTLRGEEGEAYHYSTELEELRGELSYRLSIPHQALSTGLNVDASVLPLGVGEAAYTFESIQIDGHPAAIGWSEIDFLSLMQPMRAATYRIDLIVSFDLADTDGDGIPDWWEELYGLDAQVADGSLDSDGDGWSNLAEYRNGTNPLRDDRVPSVQTTTLAAYGESENGVWLRSTDIDTPPAGLTYTLVAPPDGGSLGWADGAGGSQSGDLAVGDTFTQEQLNRGMLVYRHTDPLVTETGFTVTLADGAHEPEEAEIKIAVFPPSPDEVAAAEAAGAPVWWRDENTVFEAFWYLRQNVLNGDLVETALLYFLGKEYGWTLWDERQETLPVLLEVSGVGSHVLFGGDADDVLRGGDGDDILAGGLGANRLFGGAGLDLFIISSEGDEVIEDFDPRDDVIDLTDLLADANGLLDSYLNIRYNGIGTVIGVSRTGSGTAFTDAEIHLEGVTLVQEDLHRLWSLGQLLTGGVHGRPSITIESAPIEPLEEGQAIGELVFRRHGPANTQLAVSLNIFGTATNGTDYHLPSSISFAPGAATVTLPVEPWADESLEGQEIIKVDLRPASGYVLGERSSAEIRIIDARQRFAAHAVQAVAVVSGVPGMVEIRRTGPANQALRVFLEIGGSASAGIDYAALPAWLDFSSGQRNAYLDIVAQPNGVLGEGERSETVRIAVKPAHNGDYLVGEPEAATVRLLSNESDFESWVAEALPELEIGEGGGNLRTVSSPRTGMKALLEYAMSFGLNLDDGVDEAEKALLTPRLERGEDGLYFEFTKRLNDDRLQYVVECSHDLVNWHSATGHVQSALVSPEAENAGRVRYRIVETEGHTGQCFVRVRVEVAD